MTKPYKVMSDYLHHNASNKGSLDYILTHENVETTKYRLDSKIITVRRERTRFVAIETGSKLESNIAVTVTRWLLYKYTTHQDTKTL
ncbi:hypothetical protein YC2023_044066 [Brassica napus]